MADKKPERRAAELLDEYISERLRGRTPTVNDYLSRCPSSERDNLSEAFGGLELVVDYQCTQVDDALVDDTLAKFGAIRKKKRLFADWQVQLAQWNPTPTKDPIGKLAEAFYIPPAELARRAAASQHHPSVRFRGVSGGSGRNRASVDDARVTLIEERLRERAESILQHAAISRPPVNLQQIAQGLYLCVREVPLDDIDGCIISMDGAGAVLINSRVDNSHRRRFTLAHEIGHFVLHPNVASYEDTSDTMNDYNTTEETEANVFASMLLMPPSFLPPNFGAEKPSFEEAERLQELFEVSLVAALRRIVRQSHWGCALAVTKDGMLKWSVKSQFFDGWISSRLHSWSVAARLAESKELEEGTDVVPSQVWLEYAEKDEDVQEQVLREHSRRMGDGYIYTLLTLPHQD